MCFKTLLVCEVDKWKGQWGHSHVQNNHMAGQHFSKARLQSIRV